MQHAIVPLTREFYKDWSQYQHWGEDGDITVQRTPTDSLDF
uniref:Uncharacterized protein n=1 Tax=Anguilla anguilla TaxID=7936 RepID=A0A0E9TY90_ANGAN